MAKDKKQGPRRGEYCGLPSQQALSLSGNKRIKHFAGRSCARKHRRHTAAPPHRTFHSPPRHNPRTFPFHRAPPLSGGDACARPFLRILLHDATTIIIRHQNPRRTSFSNPDTAMPFLNPLPEKTEPHPPWEHGRLAPAPNGPCMKMAWSHCSGTRCPGERKTTAPGCNRMQSGAAATGCRAGRQRSRKGMRMP